MKLTARAVAVSAFLLAVAAAGLSAGPSLAEDAGVGFWHVVDGRRRIAEAEERDAALARETESAAHRVAMRQEVVRDVRDGRVTFEEGAQRFAELNRLQPAPLAAYTRQRFPGRTAEETAARQLLSHLRATRETAALAVASEWERVLAGRGAVTDRCGASE